MHIAKFMQNLLVNNTKVKTNKTHKTNAIHMAKYNLQKQQKYNRVDSGVKPLLWPEIFFF